MDAGTLDQHQCLADQPVSGNEPDVHIQSRTVIEFRWVCDTCGQRMHSWHPNREVVQDFVRNHIITHQTRG
jgi:hypothetical protein